MKDPDLTATVIIPTSGDRASIVRLVLDCILNQTVRDLEVFIIGDGVTGDSIRLITEMAEQEPNVHFFQNPKHDRRGEPYRDEALKQARGRIVCYCCDRDLFLSHHIETLAAALEDCDFAHTIEFIVLEDGFILMPRLIDLSREDHRKRMDSRMRKFDGLYAPGLSCVAHTLEAYRRLPEGWARTPLSHVTDCHMWQKFTQNPEMKCRTIARPSLLYFHRGGHPGWSAERRFAELEPWRNRVISDGGLYVELLEGSIALFYKQQWQLLLAWNHRFGRGWKLFRKGSLAFLKRLKNDGIYQELIARRLRK